jgi:AcrR family transcriptional regulator
MPVREEEARGVRSLKAEHAEATRQALVDSARELFAQRGYAEVPIEEIVRRARVTRGALYHHFRDKADLFRAVFVSVEEELGERVGAKALKASDPAKLLEAGCLAFIDECADPAVQRIVMLDGPSVLGWEAWRELDLNYGLGQLVTAIQVSMDGGHVEPQPIEPLAHLLLGALNEGALTIAHADNPDRARREVRASMARLLAGLG